MQYIPIVHANNATNLKKGVLKRVLITKTFQHNPEAMAMFEQYAVRLHEHVFFDSTTDKNLKVIHKMKFADWLKDFPLPKRGKLTKGLSDYKEVGISPEEMVKWKVHVKTELLNLVSPFGHKLGWPRIISEGLPNCNANIGPWVKAASKYYACVLHGKTVINTDFPNSHGLFYATGCNLQQLGDWFAEVIEFLGGDADFLENDVSKWDRHFHEMFILLENTLHAKHMSNTAKEEVLPVLMSMLETHGQGDGISFRVGGTRKSGAQNTSCGNSLINIYIHDFIMHLFNPDLKRGKHYFIAVLGDDCLIIYKKGVIYDIDKLKTHFNLWFSLLGMSSKAKTSSHWSKVEFCSSYFLPIIRDSKTSYVLVPKLGRWIIKQGWTVSRLASMHPRKQMQEIYNCYKPLTEYPLYSQILSYYNQNLTVDTLLNPFKLNFDLDETLQCHRTLLNEFTEQRYQLTLEEIEKSLSASLKRVDQLPKSILFDEVMHRVICTDNDYELDQIVLV